MKKILKFSSIWASRLLYIVEAVPKPIYASQEEMRMGNRKKCLTGEEITVCVLCKIVVSRPSSDEESGHRWYRRLTAKRPESRWKQ